MTILLYMGTLLALLGLAQAAQVQYESTHLAIACLVAALGSLGMLISELWGLLRGSREEQE